MSIIDAINEQVLILDLCSENGIGVERFSSGNFTHRCKCPSPDHKSGGERTPSLHIDSTKNDFYCYGCSAYRSAIDFYKLLNPDLTISECIDNLKGRVTASKKRRPRLNEDNFDILKEISGLLRYYNRRFPEKREELLKIQKKVDCNLEKIGYNDITNATKLLGKLRAHLIERFL